MLKFFTFCPFPLCIALLCLLLVSGQCVLAQAAPPQFSATVSVKIDDGGIIYTFQNRLYFDGKHTWRIGEDAHSQSGFYIRDEDSHVLYVVLAQPVMGMYYHKYEVNPTSPSILESFGVDDWTIYNRENPCSGYPFLSCKMLGATKLSTRACDEWQMVYQGQSEDHMELVRRVWIDRVTGITIRSELTERINNLKPRHSILELTEIYEGPQKSSLFELRTLAGEPIRAPERRPSGPYSDDVSAKDANLYTFRTTAKEVLIDATVRDNKKRAVPDLRKEDFVILEDGVEQPTLGFWYDDLPIAVALVLDHSGSMANKIGELRETAANILSGLKPQDKVALFFFDWKVDQAVELTTDRQQVANALSSIEAGGRTDVLKALFAATLYLERNAPNMRRVIILISDNLASSYTITSVGALTEADLIDAALHYETAVYDLRIETGGGKYDRPLSMKKITEQTGGEMMSSSSTAKMLDEVIKILRQRYVLSFKPAKRSDTQLHTIELRVKGPSHKYSLTYRRGYLFTPYLRR